MHCAVPPKAIEAVKAKKQGTTPNNLYTLGLLETMGICVVPASGFGPKEGLVGFRSTSTRSWLSICLHAQSDTTKNSCVGHVLDANSAEIDIANGIAVVWRNLAQHDKDFHKILVGHWRVKEIVGSDYHIIIVIIIIIVADSGVLVLKIDHRQRPSQYPA